jgi:DNA-binding CsgD family transcriptional regulator
VLVFSSSELLNLGVATFRLGAGVSKSISHDDIGVEALTGIALLEFIGSHTDFSDFCQFLIMNVLAEHEPWGACMGNFHANGTIDILGSFGIGEGLISQYEGFSSQGMAAFRGTFLNGKPILPGLENFHPEKTSQLFQAMNSHGPNALSMIESNDEPVGFVQVLFMHPIDRSQLINKLGAIALVSRASLLMYRSYSESNTFTVPYKPSHNGHHSMNGQSRNSISALNGHLKSYGSELTPRQLDILTSISLGMTNSSIARKIGFSESTVRQETVAIYRCLGVSDRKMAVLVATQNGLISSEVSTPTPRN